MFLDDRRQLSQRITRERRSLSSVLIEALLGRVLRQLERGRVDIVTPDGRSLTFEGTCIGPQARLTIHSWRCLRRLATGWDVGFAEAYAAGELSSPNIAAVLRLACANETLADCLQWLRPPRFWLKLRHALNRNTRHGSRRNISAHYDLGNAFYRLWLDDGMTYSAALFSNLTQTLEEAQDSKLDRVSDLLELTGGEQVLEIGCGWGSMAERLLARDCAVVGLTLSAEQLTFARDRLYDHCQDGRCELRLEDYRDSIGVFDRVVSIEMLEAVGEAYWPVYFEKLRDSLRPGGIAVLQVITIDEARYDAYRSRPDFIQKHIFPGGMLPTASIIESQAAWADLHLADSQFFSQSYARTLEIWRQRFQQAWPHITRLGFDERFKRLWEYYLAYCQVGFETGTVKVGFYKFVRNRT